MNKLLIPAQSTLILDQNKETKLATLEIMRVAKFDSPTHGKFEFTQETLKQVKQHFDNNTHRGVDEKGNPIIPFNFSHKSHEQAAGWVVKLELSEDKNSLLASIDLTPAGYKKAENKEFRFASIELDPKFTDPETGEKYNNVLTGVAFTNIPFIREMRPIKLDQLNLDMREILQSIEILSKEEKVALLDQLERIIKINNNKDANMSENPQSKELSLTKDEVLELSQLREENKKLKEAQELQKKELQFTLLLSQGKVTPAQKESFLKEDILGLIENSTNKLNLSQKSSQIDPKEEEGKEEKVETREDAESKILELSQITDDMSYEEANAKILETLSDKRNKDLYKLTRE